MNKELDKPHRKGSKSVHFLAVERKHTLHSEDYEDNGRALLNFGIPRLLLPRANKRIGTIVLADPYWAGVRCRLSCGKFIWFHAQCK